MPTTTLSSRGQIVIPAEVRRHVGWLPSDQITVTVADDSPEVVLRKKETLEAMADRLSRYVKPGTAPLVDIHGFYDQREARG